MPVTRRPLLIDRFISARSWAQSASRPPLPKVRTKRRKLLSLSVEEEEESPGCLDPPSAHRPPAQSPAYACRELTDPASGFPLNVAPSVELKSEAPEQRSCWEGTGSHPSGKQLSETFPLPLVWKEIRCLTTGEVPLW